MLTPTKNPASRPTEAALQVQPFRGLSVSVLPSSEHEFLLPTSQVALGYGISRTTLRRHKQIQASELIEGKHWVVQRLSTLGGSQDQTLWTKRGIVRLGFFIKSERAKLFRDWAEDFILRPAELAQLPAPSIPEAHAPLLLTDTQYRYSDMGGKDVVTFDHNGVTYYALRQIYALLGLRTDITKVADRLNRRSVLAIKAALFGQPPSWYVSHKGLQIILTAKRQLNLFTV